MGWYVPAEHWMHALCMEAPRAVEYVPGRHDWQALISVALDVVEYLPGTQYVHCDELDAEKLPVMQIWLVTVMSDMAVTSTDVTLRPLTTRVCCRVVLDM